MRKGSALAPGERGVQTKGPKRTPRQRRSCMAVGGLETNGCNHSSSISSVYQALLTAWTVFVAGFGCLNIWVPSQHDSKWLLRLVKVVWFCILRILVVGDYVGKTSNLAVCLESHPIEKSITYGIFAKVGVSKYNIPVNHAARLASLDWSPTYDRGQMQPSCAASTSTPSFANFFAKCGCTVGGSCGSAAVHKRPCWSIVGLGSKSLSRARDHGRSHASTDWNARSSYWVFLSPTVFGQRHIDLWSTWQGKRLGAKGDESPHTAVSLKNKKNMWLDWRKPTIWEVCAAWQDVWCPDALKNKFDSKRSWSRWSRVAGCWSCLISKFVHGLVNAARLRLLPGAKLIYSIKRIQTDIIILGSTTAYFAGHWYVPKEERYLVGLFSKFCLPLFSWIIINYWFLL